MVTDIHENVDDIKTLTTTTTRSSGSSAAGGEQRQLRSSGSRSAAGSNRGSTSPIQPAPEDSPSRDGFNQAINAPHDSKSYFPPPTTATWTPRRQMQQLETHKQVRIWIHYEPNDRQGRDKKTWKGSGSGIDGRVRLRNLTCTNP
jgi:hypothetical protein